MAVAQDGERDSVFILSHRILFQHHQYSVNFMLIDRTYDRINPQIDILRFPV
ncbi:MAG: hypothetical protein JGK24_18300 [Microcoleus sp. PH2017_29_MFU_D_A]|uniref:hypothetical protein n=1 Tax=unclassified Microcoleus TaxID=2642155 RepID=UPI001DBFFF4E|nr:MULTISPECIES: hypothetical protein [unclassified Microcoleus]MCC3416408.1 hypothetical protein [Microcoleus sp. PH2017_07_MST_O_A]MCC3424197.1 hypothetical protein [Microcoleus sp. PH2017_01_SCD_O_A]MCC3453435.1 hypothetical protein [Microcoleus sp. PH2017_08_TRC_O_A]MCC3471408.1 hypothetical protein [Microcoleus sp. PH2017_13_LAR_U_A]MCC3484121.1 hypothetical protein [Microcoleus sp. PH2017_14_LAR_D_A]